MGKLASILFKLYKSGAPSVRLPCICAICFDETLSSISLCDYCRSMLPTNTTQCRLCGIPHGTTADCEQLCGQCVISPPIFDSCRTAFLYEPPVSNLITRFKFNANFADGRVLSKLLAEVFESYYAAGHSQLSPESKPELLIPVPLHSRRLRARGFNQATEIAKVISRLTGIALTNKLVLRTRDTTSQSELGATERAGNLKLAFSIRDEPSLKGLKHVAVIDDVVTTMATVTSVARTLKNAGVERVDIWAIARALQRS